MITSEEFRTEIKKRIDDLLAYVLDTDTDAKLISLDYTEDIGGPGQYIRLHTASKSDNSDIYLTFKKSGTEWRCMDMNELIFEGIEEE